MALSLLCCVCISVGLSWFVCHQVVCVALRSSVLNVVYLFNAISVYVFVCGSLFVFVFVSVRLCVGVCSTS